MGGCLVPALFVGKTVLSPFYSLGTFIIEASFNYVMNLSDRAKKHLQSVCGPTGRNQINQGTFTLKDALVGILNKIPMKTFPESENRQQTMVLNNCK